MSDFMWVSKSEFQELKDAFYGMKSNALDIKYSCGSVNLDLNNGSEDTGSTGVGSVPAKVTGKTGIYHLVDLYANGIDNTATTEDQKVFVLQLNLAETLPVGSWIMVGLSSIGQTGGGNVA